MVLRARVVSLIFAGFFAVAAVAACGGESFEGGSPDTAGRGGTAGSAGAGSGGTLGRAGASGAGGAQGGSGGSVSTRPERCEQPKAVGACNAYFPSYWHNPSTGVCEPFGYGGCEGNDNRFESLEDCQATCQGGAVDLDACTRNSECVLVAAGCCTACAENATLSNFVAIRADGKAAFDADRQCDVACGACPEPDVTTNQRAYLVATCRNGQCAPVDLRAEGATDCADAADCTLRAGAGCCEACGGTEDNTVAISDPAALGALVCDEGPAACPACAPLFPAEYVSQCEDSQCVVRRSSLPGG